MEALISDAVQKLRIDSGDFVVNGRDLHVCRHLRSTCCTNSRPARWAHRAQSRARQADWLTADRPLLQLALRQLLDNALKYSPLDLHHRHPRVRERDGRSCRAEFGFD